jgi:hypothetical protein
LKRFFSGALFPIAASVGCNVPAATPDPLFQDPYIDTDEWRDAPVRHRNVHGGFKGTATRFSYYLPPKEQYQGRFFQYITPMPDSETVSQGATAGQRRGVQPVIALQANGAEWTEVATGQEVNFSASIEVPPRTGKIVSVEWDFEGVGTFPVAGELPKSPRERVVVK